MEPQSSDTGRLLLPLISVTLLSSRGPQANTAWPQVAVGAGHLGSSGTSPPGLGDAGWAAARQVALGPWCPEDRAEADTREGLVGK